MEGKSREIERSIVAFVSGEFELTQDLWGLIYSEWTSNGNKTLDDADVRRLQAKLASRANRCPDRDNAIEQMARCGRRSTDEYVSLVVGILARLDGQNYGTIKDVMFDVLDISKSLSRLSVDAIETFQDRPNNASAGKTANETIV